MSQTKATLKYRLQEFLGFSGKTKDDRELSQLVASWPGDRINEVLDLIDQISAAEAANYVIGQFSQLDQCPQPADRMISHGELINHLSLLEDARQQAIILMLWLSFEDIRNATTGDAPDAVFDYQISCADIAQWGKTC